VEESGGAEALQVVQMMYLCLRPRTESRCGGGASGVEVWPGVRQG